MRKSRRVSSGVSLTDISLFRGSSRLFKLEDASGLATRLLMNPVLAYGAIVALQLRIIWNIWNYRDLTRYDTAQYFIGAVSWTHGLHTDIIYSPFYEMLWGTILWVVHSVYAAAIIDRVAIIVGAAVLVLAVMRALVGPVIGMLMAVWWVIIPANFDGVYEVHLFGLLPILIAILVVYRVPRRVGLGVGFAILVGSAALIRNELILSAGLFAVALVFYEIRQRAVHTTPISTYVRAYGIPILVMSLLVGGVYSRSYFQGHQMQLAFEEKQELNLCEAYAFNYQQRYPSRVIEPFPECPRIMRHDFGSPMPSMITAVEANPRAMAGFVAWNAQLLPSGLQVALFNATSTKKNPSYRPVEEKRNYALVLSLALIAVLVAGSVALYRDRNFWLRKWLPSRRWPLGLLGIVMISTLIVALTERPWADYIYGLTFGILAMTGLCCSALLRSLRGSRFAALVVCVLTVVLIVILPSYYTPAPRPLDAAVDHAQLISSQLQRPGSVLVTDEDGTDICSYLAESFDRYCTGITWLSLRAQISSSASVGTVLKRAKATAIYVDPAMLNDPIIAGLLAAPQAAGWRQVAGGNGPEGPWRILIPSGS